MEELEIMQDQLAQLRFSYRSTLPKQVEEIQSLYKNLRISRFDENSFAKLHRIVHSLAGTAGTYGFTKIGSIAAKLDLHFQEAIDSTVPADNLELSHINRLLQELATEMTLLS